MLDILLAVKNNNVNKMPHYDPSHLDHLKKVLKTFVREGCLVTELKIGLEDIQQAETRKLMSSSLKSQELGLKKGKQSVDGGMIFCKTFHKNLPIRKKGQTGSPYGEILNTVQVEG